MPGEAGGPAEREAAPRGSLLGRGFGERAALSQGHKGQPVLGVHEPALDGRPAGGAAATAAATAGVGPREGDAGLPGRKRDQTRVGVPLPGPRPLRPSERAVGLTCVTAPINLEHV